jgi:hypothetical protein
MNAAVNGKRTSQVADGDYAALVESLSGAPPGKVQKETKPSRPPGYDVMPWFIAVVQASIYGGLSYLALYEHMITLPGKRGDHFHNATAATWIGFALLAAAMVVLLRPIRRRRVHLAVGMMLLATWLAAVAFYLAT